MMKHMEQKKVVEKKEKKEWVQKPKQTAEEKREAAKRAATYAEHRSTVREGDVIRWETIDECLERVAMEEAAKKQQWKKDHEVHAAEEQRIQEKNRLLPKPKVRSDKAFGELVRSVGWYATDVELDRVLDQLSVEELGKLWIQTPLWDRAHQRKLIRNVEITGEFLRGSGISEKKMVHVELDASARTSDTVFMSVVNRDRK
jgi:hypothetical protein